MPGGGRKPLDYVGLGGGRLAALATATRKRVSSVIPKLLKDDPSAILGLSAGTLIVLFKPDGPTAEVEFFLGFVRMLTEIAADAFINALEEMKLMIDKANAETMQYYLDTIGTVAVAAGALVGPPYAGPAAGVLRNFAATAYANLSATGNQARANPVRLGTNVPNQLSPEQYRAEQIRLGRAAQDTRAVLERTREENRVELARRDALLRTATARNNAQLAAAREERQAAQMANDAMRRDAEATASVPGKIANAIVNSATTALMLHSYEKTRFYSMLGLGASLVAFLYKESNLLRLLSEEGRKSAWLAGVLRALVYYLGLMFSVAIVQVTIAYYRTDPQEVTPAAIEARFEGLDSRIAKIESLKAAIGKKYTWSDAAIFWSIQSVAATLKTVEAIYMPKLVAVLVDQGILQAPEQILTRPLTAEESAELQGGQKLKFRGPDKQKALDFLKDVELDGDILSSRMKSMKGADLSKYPRLAKGALDSVWSVGLLSATDPNARSYRFCSIEMYEGITGLTWPTPLSSRAWALIGSTPSRVPTGAANGIAISTLLLDDPLRTVNSGLRYVAESDQSGIRVADEDLVAAVFGRRGSLSEIPTWRWEATRTPEILADLDNRWQHEVVESVVSLEPLNGVLARAGGEDPTENPVVEFIKKLAMSLFYAFFIYKTYPAYSLEISEESVAYPDTGEAQSLSVNTRLWKAWNLLRPSVAGTVGKWQNADTLDLFLKSNTRTMVDHEILLDSFKKFKSAFSIETDTNKRIMMSQLLNLDPLLFGSPDVRRHTNACRYALYLLIPEVYRGPFDAFIGGIYTAIVWRGSPGRCETCDADAEHIKWLFKPSGGPGEPPSVIAGWTVSRPGSNFINSAENRQDVLDLLKNGQDGCIKCFRDECTRRIDEASTDEEKRQLAAAYAVGTRRDVDLDALD